jgi:hypothetical protein
VLQWKPEIKRSSASPTSRWEDNIKMDLQEVGWVIWTRLIWIRIRTGGWYLWLW